MTVWLMRVLTDMGHWHECPIPEFIKTKERGKEGKRKEGREGKGEWHAFVFASPIIIDNHSCMVQASELIPALIFYLIPDAANDFVTFTFMQQL